MGRPGQHHPGLRRLALMMDACNPLVPRIQTLPRGTTNSSTMLTLIVVMLHPGLLVAAASTATLDVRAT